MVNETHEDLLVIISMWEDEPEAAHTAFDAFFEAYKNYVWYISTILAKSLPNPKIATNDIFSDTFLAVRDNADKFDPKKCKNKQNGIKNWLSGVAKNQFLRYVDAAAKANGNVEFLETCPDVPVFDASSPPPLNADDSPPKLGLLNTAIERALNGKEREILFISLNFESQGGLPTDIKQSLCKAYGVMPATLRKIKERAIKKLQDYIRKNTFSPVKKVKSNA